MDIKSKLLKIERKFPPILKGLKMTEFLLIMWSMVIYATYKFAWLKY